MEELSTRLYIWRKALPLIAREWWKENRDFADDCMPAIPLRRAAPYDIREAHRRAHTQHNPLLAPHGFLRALPSKRNTAAIEFVEKFGPLDWPVVVGENPVLVLHDFWLKHLRYVSVIRLWEARDDEGHLRSAFSDLYKNLDQIHFAEGSESFDQAPNTRLSDPFLPLSNRVPLFPLGTSSASSARYLLPWERSEHSFEEWLSGAIFEKLREAAIEIFHRELNVHLFGREPCWFRTDVDDPRQPVSFQLFFGRGNLWQIIWELTALDTAQVRSWRICPDCNVLFYPKRSDQYYCRSEEQIRASKRNYARTRRQRERLNNLLAPTGDSPANQREKKRSEAK